MKKFTFLLSLLLAFVGVTASAQSLKFSDAPSDGTWASNTQWYLIRVAYTDDYHPKAGISTQKTAILTATDYCLTMMLFPQPTKVCGVL